MKLFKDYNVVSRSVSLLRLAIAEIFIYLFIFCFYLKGLTLALEVVHELGKYYNLDTDILYVEGEFFFIMFVIVIILINFLTVQTKKYIYRCFKKLFQKVESKINSRKPSKQHFGDKVD